MRHTSRVPAQIVGEERQFEDIDFDALAVAERAGDDVLVVTLAGLFLGHRAHRDLLGDERVVGADLVERVGADEVGTAVADVADDEVGPAEGADDQRRAHHVVFTLGRSVGEDALVGQPEGLLDHQDDIVRVGAAEAFDERVDRHLGGGVRA